MTEDVLADRYELRRTLGVGGMARVVQAHDRVLHRDVAIKMLRGDVALDASVRERFLREARTAAGFDHPNAVVIFDTGQEGDEPWIVMELVDGENLAERLRGEGALDEVEALRIADPVLAALAHAHSQGLVHRDVKPDNIMLLSDGRVKIADFGIAKTLDDAAARLTATGQITGTPAYLSPEQVNGEPATPASDVYAMGIVLYEMLVGSPPYSGEDPIAVAVAHNRSPVPDVQAAQPAVSPGVAAALTHALAKDPAERYSDASAFRAELAAAAPDGTLVIPAATTQVLPAEGGGTSPLQQAASSLGRVWWWGVAGAAALALVAVVALMLAARPAGEPTTSAPTEPAQAQTEEPATEAAPKAQDGGDDNTGGRDGGKAKGKGQSKGKGKGRGKND